MSEVFDNSPALVPVDHEPEFDHSLVPVDHDPFSPDEVARIKDAMASYGRQRIGLEPRDWSHPPLSAGQSVSTYSPSPREAIGGWLAGDAPLGSPRREFVEKLIGSSGLNGGFGLVDLVPGVGQAMEVGDAAHDRDPQSLAMAMIPGAGGGAGRGGEKLSMEFADRMARARALGFDTTQPLYHGTGAEFSEFRAVPTTDAERLAPGVSVALNPEVADHFAEMAGRGRERGFEWSTSSNQGSPQIYKVFLRTDNPAALTLTGNEDHHQVVATLHDAFDRGYDSVRVNNYIGRDGKPSDIIFVKNANQLRSPQAAFDPARKFDANLLAGIGGMIALPAGALMLRPDEHDPSEE